MKPQLIFIGLLMCVGVIGCAHGDRKAESFSMRAGPTVFGGVTYYPAHPGTTSYGIVDYTTNPPPAGAKTYVDVVTTNGHWRVNLIDGGGDVFTNSPGQ